MRAGSFGQRPELARVEPERQRRNEHEGDDPRQHHPDAAHHPELPEPLELGEGEGRIGRACRERSRQGAGARAAHRGLHGLRHRDAASPLLHVAREEHDAEVDPVADDDRGEKRRVRVEHGHVQGRQRRDPEGVDRGQQQRRDEHEETAQPAEVEDDDHADAEEHEDGRDRQIGHQRFGLLHGRCRVGRVPHAHALRVRVRSAQRLHVGAHALEQTLRRPRSSAGAPHLDEHERQVLLGAREAAVRHLARAAPSSCPAALVWMTRTGLPFPPPFRAARCALPTWWRRPPTSSTAMLTG